MAHTFDDATTLARREFWKGSVGSFGEDDVRLPDGRRITLGVLHHPGAAAVVPLLPDGRVVLLRQYRYAVRATLWEVPAGKLDEGEAPETCARRELEEETGYTASKLLPLGSIFMTPGFCDERIHLYLATGLQPGRRSPMADESIYTELMPLPAAVRMAQAGEICDAKSVIALLRAAQAIDGG